MRKHPERFITLLSEALSPLAKMPSNEVNELVVSLKRDETVDRINSEQRTCLGKLQAWTSGIYLRAIPVTEIAEEIRFDVTFGKELLLTVFATTGSEKFLIDPGIIEARHWSTVES